MVPKTNEKHRSFKTIKVFCTYGNSIVTNEITKCKMPSKRSIFLFLFSRPAGLVKYSLCVVLFTNNHLFAVGKSSHGHVVNLGGNYWS